MYRKQVYYKNHSLISTILYKMTQPGPNISTLHKNKDVSKLLKCQH